MSKAHIICGMTGTGKTTLVQNLIRHVPNKQAFFIYDINNEYREFFQYPLMDFEDFAYKSTLLNNAVIIFEEATIFLDGRFVSDRYIQKTLILKRHRNNFIFLIFHAVAEIAPFAYRLSNYITLFKTNDLPDLSARELRDPRLKPIMERVKHNKNMFYHETLKIL